MAMKSLATQELADFLGITRQGLKKLVDNSTLPARLMDKGYRLLGSSKQGRKIVYTMEEVVVVTVEAWEEIRKREFSNIKKADALDTHCEERLIKGTVIPNEIIKKTGVTRQTSERWDGLLVEKGLMSHNGYSYYYIAPNKELEQITYGEYLDFWRQYNKKKLDAEDLANMAECEDGEVTSRDIRIAQGGICIKVKSFLVHQFTEKYQTWAAAIGSRKK